MKNRISTVDFTRSILETYQINPKSRYGQNFLVSPTIPALISGADEITKDSLVVEIGPGLGALTQFLCEKAKKVICFEIDTKLCDVLKESLSDYDNFEIVNEDFLCTNLDNIAFNSYKNVVFVSNLPYYITSEILIKLLQYEQKFTILAMMQKEVAHRILQKDDLNDLVIYSSLFSSVSKFAEVSKNDFFPKPNVDSTVLKFVKNDIKSRKQYIEIISALLEQRRKTIFNNLKIINGHEMHETYIDYVLLCNNLTRLSRIDDLKLGQIFNLIEFIKNTIYIKTPAKINFGLKIIGKENGYHLLKTTFLPINMYDEIEIYVTKETFKLQSNVNICDLEDNTVFKAYSFLNKKVNFGLDVIINKHIPIGSGLGGGSSDAGAIINLLSNIFNIDDNDKKECALSVGTDTLFFLNPMQCYVDGDLSKFYPLEKKFINYNVHLLISDINVKTKEIFDLYDTLIDKRASNSNEYSNDLEQIVLSKYPQLKEVKDRISNQKIYSMSGSGPTYYYIVDEKEDKTNDKYTYKIID